MASCRSLRGMGLRGRRPSAAGAAAGATASASSLSPQEAPPTPPGHHAVRRPASPGGRPPHGCQQLFVVDTDARQDDERRRDEPGRVQSTADAGLVDPDIDALQGEDRGRGERDEVEESQGRRAAERQRQLMQALELGKQHVVGDRDTVDRDPLAPGADVRGRGEPGSNPCRAEIRSMYVAVLVFPFVPTTTIERGENSMPAVRRRLTAPRSRRALRAGYAAAISRIWRSAGDGAGPGIDTGFVQ